MSKFNLNDHVVEINMKIEKKHNELMKEKVIYAVNYILRKRKKEDKNLIGEEEKISSIDEALFYVNELGLVSIHVKKYHETLIYVNDGSLEGILYCHIKYDYKKEQWNVIYEIGELP